MPTYTYECEKCGHVEELFRSFSEREDPHECPKDQGNMVQIIGSTAPFIRKGAGIFSVDTGVKKWSDYE